MLRNHKCPARGCGKKMVRFLNPERWVCPNEHNHEALRIAAEADDRRREGSARGRRAAAASGTPEERHARAVARGKASQQTPSRRAARAEKAKQKEIEAAQKATEREEKKRRRERGRVRGSGGRLRKTSRKSPANNPNRDPASGKFVKKKRNGKNGK